MSNERSYLPSDSTTIGTRFIGASLIKCNPRVADATCNRTVADRRRAMQVTREIELPSPPQEVWEALTDADRLEQWFASKVELELEPGGRGVFRWGDGEERHAIVQDVEIERRFAFVWGEDETRVSIELEEIPG